MFDNLDLFYIHQREQDKTEAKRPTCAWCGEPIWSEKALKLPDSGLLCDSCIEDNQEWVEEEE